MILAILLLILCIVDIVLYRFFLLWFLLMVEIFCGTLRLQYYFPNDRVLCADNCLRMSFAELFSSQSAGNSHIYDLSMPQSVV